jgi:hypothetical protein
MRLYWSNIAKSERRPFERSLLHRSELSISQDQTVSEMTSQILKQGSQPAIKVEDNETIQVELVGTKSKTSDMEERLLQANLENHAQSVVLEAKAKQITATQAELMTSRENHLSLHGEHSDAALKCQILEVQLEEQEKELNQAQKDINEVFLESETQYTRIVNLEPLPNYGVINFPSQH